MIDMTLSNIRDVLENDPSSDDLRLFLEKLVDVTLATESWHVDKFCAMTHNLNRTIWTYVKDGFVYCNLSSSILTIGQVNILCLLVKGEVP